MKPKKINVNITSLLSACSSLLNFEFLNYEKYLYAYMYNIYIRF